MNPFDYRHHRDRQYKKRTRYILGQKLKHEVPRNENYIKEIKEIKEVK